MDSGYKTSTTGTKRGKLMRQKVSVSFCCIKGKDSRVSLAKTVAVSCATVLFLVGTMWLGYKILNAASTYMQVVQTSNDGSLGNPMAWGKFNVGIED